MSLKNYFFFLVLLLTEPYAAASSPAKASTINMIIFTLANLEYDVIYQYVKSHICNNLLDSNQIFNLDMFKAYTLHSRIQSKSAFKVPFFIPSH